MCSSENRRLHARTLIAWPGWPHLGYAVWLGVLFAIWLELVYGSTDYVTSLRTFRVRVHLDTELAMPFVPAMSVFYLSIFPLMWLAPFVLRARCELRALVETMSWVTLCAGVVFLLFPAELAYATHAVPVPWHGLYDLADVLNLRYNVAPSLHVALAVTCVIAYTRAAPRAARLVLWAWGAAIALSTLLTHQHHVLDVISGFVLAVAVSRWIARRRARRAASANVLATAHQDGP